MGSLLSSLRSAPTMTSTTLPIFVFVNATVFESQLVRIVDMPSDIVTTQLKCATNEPVDIAIRFGIIVQSIMYSFVGRLQTAGSPSHAVASL